MAQIADLLGEGGVNSGTARRLVRDEGSPMHVFLFCRGHSP